MVRKEPQSTKPKLLTAVKSLTPEKTASRKDSSQKGSAGMREAISAGRATSDDGGLDEKDTITPTATPCKEEQLPQDKANETTEEQGTRKRKSSALYTESSHENGCLIGHPAATLDRLSAPTYQITDPPSESPSWPLNQSHALKRSSLSQSSSTPTATTYDFTSFTTDPSQQRWLTPASTPLARSSTQSFRPPVTTPYHAQQQPHSQAHLSALSQGTSSTHPNPSTIPAQQQGLDQWTQPINPRQLDQSTLYQYKLLRLRQQQHQQTQHQQQPRSSYPPQGSSASNLRTNSSPAYTVDAATLTRALAQRQSITSANLGRRSITLSRQQQQQQQPRFTMNSDGMAAESPVLGNYSASETSASPVLTSDSDLGGPTGFEGELGFLSGPATTTDFSTDQDFALFDESPETNISYDSPDHGASSMEHSNNNKITASPTEMWQPTEGEYSAAAARSAASTFLATPPLGHYSTPEDVAMSTQATPLFGNSEDMTSFNTNASLDMFDSQFSPDAEDLSGWMGSNKATSAPQQQQQQRAPATSATAASPAAGSVSMTRNNTSASNGRKVLSPVYTGISKQRKRNKLVEELDPDDGQTTADKKRIKNTLAARSSRARKVARMEALEVCATTIHRQSLMLYQWAIDNGLEVPPELQVSEVLALPGPDGKME